MEKQIATTRAELIKHIRGFVYTQILKGAGWCDEIILKDRMRWLLGVSIENKTGKDIYGVYKQLFDGGVLGGINGEVFKKKQYAVYTSDENGNLKTCYNTLIYRTASQLKCYEKVLADDAKAEAREEAEAASHADPEEYEDDE